MIRSVQRCSRFCLVMLAVTLGCQAPLAQLPAARISTIFPPGGKAGTTVEVSLSGADLDDANQLLFSDTNIVATPKLVGATGQPDPNKFTIAIGAAVPLGVYDARVAGRFGVSNPRSFVVGDLPEAASPATNHAAASAFEVALDSAVNGRAGASAVDYFRFAARKGQRVLVRCLTAEIDSRMDEVLVLCDGNDKEVERNRRGGLLDFTAP